MIRGNQIRPEPKKQSHGSFIIMIILLILVLACVIVLAIRNIGKSVTVDGAVEAEHSTKETGVGTEKWQEGNVSYNGAIYRYNKNIKTYLFLGIDKDGEAIETENQLLGGQSDAMFLLVENPDKKDISVIAINRNTMTDIDTYDEEGNFLGTQKLQICLAHGYGDGMYLSCQRSEDAVSSLFYNIPINGYLSMSMDGIVKMNDMLGGVTVTPEEEIRYNGTVIAAGEPVKLTGEQAYAYLRYRDINEDNSATKRLNRQIEYITSLFESMNKDIGLNQLLVTYQAVEPYIVTNIDVAALAEDIQAYAFDADQMYSVPGEMYYGTFEEYHVDETSLYEMILDIFYDKVQNE